MNFYGNQNFKQHSVQDAIIHKGAAFPSSPQIGQLFWNTATITLYVYTPSGWSPFSAMSPNFNLIHNVYATWVTNQTVRVGAGYVEIDGTSLTNTGDTTLDITVSGNWVGTHPATGRLPVYVYVFAVGSNFGVKLSTDAPQFSNAGTITDRPLSYRMFSATWYRCVGSFIVDFDETPDLALAFNVGFAGKQKLYYLQNSYLELLTSNVANAWTDVDLTNVVPTTAKLALIRLYGDGASADGGIILRPNGGSLGGATPTALQCSQLGSKSFLAANAYGITYAPVLIGTARKIQYYANSVINNFHASVVGYYEEL